MRYYLLDKVTKVKMVIGVSAQGSTYTLRDKRSHGLGASTKGPGKPYNYTQTNGWVSYFEVRTNGGNSILIIGSYR